MHVLQCAQLTTVIYVRVDMLTCTHDRTLAPTEGEDRTAIAVRDRCAFNWALIKTLCSLALGLMWFLCFLNLCDESVTMPKIFRALFGSVVFGLEDTVC